MPTPKPPLKLSDASAERTQLLPADWLVGLARDPVSGAWRNAAWSARAVAELAAAGTLHVLALPQAVALDRQYVTPTGVWQALQAFAATEAPAEGSFWRNVVAFAAEAGTQDTVVITPRSVAAQALFGTDQDVLLADFVESVAQDLRGDVPAGPGGTPAPGGAAVTNAVFAETDHYDLAHPEGALPFFQLYNAQDQALLMPTERLSPTVLRILFQPPTAGRIVLLQQA